LRLPARSQLRAIKAAASCRISESAFVNFFVFNKTKKKNKERDITASTSARYSPEH
jgi:hypothetical protein